MESKFWEGFILYFLKGIITTTMIGVYLYEAI